MAAKRTVRSTAEGRAYFVAAAVARAERELNEKIAALVAEFKAMVRKEA